MHIIPYQVGEGKGEGEGESEVEGEGQGQGRCEGEAAVDPFLLSCASSSAMLLPTLRMESSI